MVKKFLRRTWSRYSKLGKRRKKKQVWRRPTGRDNKMREKRKGYPCVVSVGYKKDGKMVGTIEGKKPVIIENIKGLENVKKNELVIFGSVGKKKKMEIAKKAKQMKIQIYKTNINKFVEKNKKIKKEKKVEVKKEKKVEVKKEKKVEVKKEKKVEVKKESKSKPAEEKK